MYQIAIADSQDCLDIDEEFLTQVAEQVLANEQVAAAEVSVAFVDDETIHALNRQYLNHDYATDVLSFLLDCEPAQKDAAEDDLPATLRGRSKRLDGELIISTETARRDAEKFGWSPREEVVLYLIHGILHLVGYDDLSNTEQAVMRARERAMLAEFQITPPTESSSGEDGPSLSSSAESDSGETDSAETEDPPDEGSPGRTSPPPFPHSRRTES